MSATCRHRRTTHNEQDGTLYCEQCHSWVLPEEYDWRTTSGCIDICARLWGTSRGEAVRRLRGVA